MGDRLWLRILSAARSIETRMTVREAREDYFRRNGLSEAGYADRCVRLRVGPVSVWFPNTAARRRAVKLHDLHHVATGYDTTWTGEGEIAAWELAAGCGRHLAAWLLNAGGLAIGIAIAPRRTCRAWKRGWRSRSLYAARELDESMLDIDVAELRARLQLAP
jgi:hypothetical protein